MNPPLEKSKCVCCGKPAVLYYKKGGLCVVHTHLFKKPAK